MLILAFDRETFYGEAMFSSGFDNVLDKPKTLAKVSKHT
jgi:hypothetical protein